MKIIFGTTNKRKIEDLENVIKELGLDIDVLSMSDIGWDRGDIVEDGKTIEENSLIKAKAIFNFCTDKELCYPILTDDAGLFCDALNGKPGIYTARYADDELEQDMNLPKYQCVIKLLRNLEGVEERTASYRCSVTCMMPNGSYFQVSDESKGHISEDIVGELKKPYFYSVFILDKYNKVFSDLSEEELNNTYRYNSLRKVLTKFIDYK